MNRPVVVILVSWMGVIALCSGAIAQQPAAQRSAAAAQPPTVIEQPKKGLVDLAADARSAKENFKPVAKADVLAREVAAEAALRRLDRYLKASGANGQGWIAYLHLAEVDAEL